MKLANISAQAQGHYFLLGANGQLFSVAQIEGPMTNNQMLIRTNSEEHSQQILQLLQ